MRTGAIFARGSCRALKWAALLGAVFMLGGGQALAQDSTAPELSSAMFEPGKMTVSVTANEPVYGSPNKDDFTVTGSEVTRVVMATSSGSPSTMITLHVKEAIETGSTPELTYTQPDAAGKQIKDAAGNAMADRTSAVTVAEKDVAPMLGEVDNKTLPAGKRIDPISLPEGTGGNGVLTYTLLLVESDNDDVTDNTEITTSEDAGTGLSFLASPPTILGTPTAEGKHELRLTVTDGDGTGNSLTGPESASQDFMITVEGEDYTPTDGLKVMVKSVTAAGTVAEGGVLDVTVIAKVPEGKGKIPSRMVTVSFPTDNSKIMKSERADPGEFDLINPDGDMYYEWEDIPLKEKESEATFKFRVEVNRDVDAEDEKFQIAVRIDEVKGKEVRTKDVLMVDDAETQKYTLTLPSAAKGAITEGAEDATKLTLKADPERTMNIPVSMALNPNDPAKYSLTFTATEFGMDPATVTATIKAMADKNRTEDTITVTAYTDGSLGNKTELASLNIKVKDANPLPGVRARVVDKDGKTLDPQPKSVTEGETLMVMLTAVDKDGDSMKTGEKLSVRLMSAGTAGSMDYRLSANPIEIASGKESSDAVDLMVLADDDVGEEMLTFDAVVSGDEKVGPGSNSVMGVLSLTIMDGTTKLVWAKTQEEVEAAVYAAKEKGAGDDKTFSPGEMMEVMGNALFSAAEGVTLSYTAATDSDAVMTSTSGGTVTVTAKEAGMAHVTITAHATGPNGVKILDQTEPDEASIMFPVEVGLEALTLELKGPDDMMDIVEGGMAHANGTPGSAMITVMANRAVTEAVTVNLMLDRTKSGPGMSADDYNVEPIVIEAGKDSGSTTLTAVSDDMEEGMEELVLFGVAEDNAGMVTGDVHLHIWDAAVPALPVIAQLLLAAFLAVGGYRRYRRR